MGRPLRCLALSRDPRLQPGADVSAARDRGQVVEPVQEIGPGERLQDAEVERRAADAAAREAERGELVTSVPCLLRDVCVDVAQRLRLDRVVGRRELLPSRPDARQLLPQHLGERRPPPRLGRLHAPSPPCRFTLRLVTRRSPRGRGAHRGSPTGLRRHVDVNAVPRVHAKWCTQRGLPRATTRGREGRIAIAPGTSRRTLVARANERVRTSRRARPARVMEIFSWRPLFARDRSRDGPCDGGGAW